MLKEFVAKQANPPAGTLRERWTVRAEQLSLLLVVMPFSVKLGVREQSAKMFIGRNKLPTDLKKAFNFE